MHVPASQSFRSPAYPLNMHVECRLCVLKHVYSTVDASVKAMNKLLPKNGKVRHAPTSHH